MTKESIIEKVLSFCFVILLLTTLSHEHFTYMYILLGFGHIILAYWYKVGAGKVSRIQGAVHLSVLLVLGSTFYMYQFRAHLTFITAIYFTWHFLTDEHFLIQNNPNRMRGLEMAPTFILFTGFELYNIYRLPVMAYSIIIATVLLGAYFLITYKSHHKLVAVNFYFLGFTCLMYLYIFLKGYLYFDIWACVIILHYMNWYFNYYFKLRHNKQKLKKYYRDVIITNVIVFGLGFYYFSYPQQLPFLNYFFPLPYFYLWTFMHVFTSTRKKDLAYFLPSLTKS